MGYIIYIYVYIYMGYIYIYMYFTKKRKTQKTPGAPPRVIFSSSAIYFLQHGGLGDHKTGIVLPWKMWEKCGKSWENDDEMWEKLGFT